MNYGNDVIQDAIRLPHHFRCASHTLSLIATTDAIKAMNNHEDVRLKHNSVIFKCKCLWKALQSPQKKEKNWIIRM